MAVAERKMLEWLEDVETTSLISCVALKKSLLQHRKTLFSYVR